MASRKRVSNEDFGTTTKPINLAAPTPGSNDGARIVDVETASTNDRSRNNHTGTQTASTISDFDAQARTSRTTQFAPPTAGGNDPLNLNGSEITNLKVAAADTSAAQWGQVKDLLSGQRKTDVRLVQTASNATLSGLPTIDGVATSANDRVLVVGNGTANGIYVVGSGAWVRAADADQSSEFSTQWLVTIREGSANGDTLYQHTTDGVVTLGTTVLTFNKIGPIASATVTGFAANSPSVAAGGSWTANHALGTTDVIAQVKRVASPFDFVDVYIETTDANNVTIKPDVAIASGEFRVLVKAI